MKNLSQEPRLQGGMPQRLRVTFDKFKREERHKGYELPLISSKVQLRTRGENSTHYENSIYCLPSNEATKSI